MKVNNDFRRSLYPSMNGWRSMMLGGLLLTLLFWGCKRDCDPIEGIDPRAEMQMLVREISAMARAYKPGCIVIANNGLHLLGKAGAPEQDYLDAIDGVMFESLYFKSNNDLKSANAEVVETLKFAKSMGVRPLVIDFCKKDAYVQDSYERNRVDTFLSFASPKEEFDQIPTYENPSLLNFNNDDIENLDDAQNFLHINRYDHIGNKEAVVAELKNSEFDLINMDPFFGKTELFSNTDLNSIRNKPQGGRRLLIAYISIGEAECYRYYWKQGWKPGYPDFIACVSPYGNDNFRVKYWEQAWRVILDSYLKEIFRHDYDGVFLDVVDAYTSFE